MTEAKMPPHNNEAEQAVLACLMLEPDTFDRLSGKLSAEDFYKKNNAVIFKTIEKLHESGQPYDLSSVMMSLSASDQEQQAGGVDYLMGLTFILPNSANLEQYAIQVKGKSDLRALERTSRRIAEIAHKYDKDITLSPTDAVNEASGLLFELSQGQDSGDFENPLSLVTEVYDRAEYLQQLGSGLAGMPCGYHDIDKFTSGLQGGHLWVVAGRPAMGKTAFALNIAEHTASKGGNVAIFSLEMTAAQLMMRVISMCGQINSWKMQNGKMSGDDWIRFSDTCEKVSKMEIRIDDKSTISVAEIRSKCRKMKAKQGLDLVIVDYLQLMEGRKGDNREQQIAGMSRQIKTMAKELNVPILLLSQLNRSLESRQNKRPIASDLRESGAIEQDADIIMFLYRDEVYEPNTTDKGIAEVIVAKNRYGEIGTVKLGFQGEYTKFRNLVN